MENSIIANFKRLKDELEQKGYAREQQLKTLIPLFEDILNSMQDLYQSEKEKYDDFVSKFELLRAGNKVDKEDKENYYKIERYKRNTLTFLSNQSLEVSKRLKAIIDEQ